MSDEVSLEFKGKVAVITFNLPKALNALTYQQYIALGKAMEEANEDEDSVVTIIQSSGRFFSAGANMKDVGSSSSTDHEYWLQRFVGRNVWLADVFHNHKKIIVAAVNGPAIGLSAALLALSDVIYVKEKAKFYLLAPFSNLGLVCEGMASASLYQRLGWSLASEAIVFARPIQGEVLERVGFINKSFDGQFSSTEEFNAAIEKMVTEMFENLYYPSMLANKQLLKANRDAMLNAANAKEAVVGFDKWIQGVPQDRFKQLREGKIKHKM
ncbi:hypothetical protein DIURU_005426 [Diutina rugosa]|uniref:Uncharacterized protein n=1 Tax=Diutina rugosa TaxID=5481 RepID=A0A642UHU4_DIURU|nr:uncharacterized protein DIURU_005426 [Diutina rugosa]KAA8897193.1 hypothetical protein DIURU_005426 [Diutina rugosa]